MNNLKVLSLEDDNDLALVMSHYFEDEGHTLTQVDTGHACLDAIQSNQFDVLLMDLGLPDMDGLSLIPQIKQHYNGPIIIVSGKTDTTDRVVGLEMGADDYIVKPFEMRELLARIKANVRHQIPTAPINNAEGDFKIYRFAHFAFDEGKLELKDDKNTIVDLTSGEAQLLQLFLSSDGRVLTREYLHDQTRDGSYESYDRAVDIAVTRLRKKLNDDPNEPNIIKTVRGVGYMFIADIQVI